MSRLTRRQTHLGSGGRAFCPTGVAQACGILPPGSMLRQGLKAGLQPQNERIRETVSVTQKILLMMLPFSLSQTKPTVLPRSESFSFKDFYCVSSKSVTVFWVHWQVSQGTVLIVSSQAAPCSAASKVAATPTRSLLISGADTASENQWCNLNCIRQG